MKYTSKVKRKPGELMAQQTDDVIWIKGKHSNTVIKNQLIKEVH